MTKFNSLDFDKIKSIISDYSPILESKELILNERIVYNPLIINRKISETNEFLEFLKKENNISFDGIVSPLSILNKAKKNSTLTSNELYQFYVFHNHSNRIKNIISKNDSLPLIKEYSDSINTDNYVEELFNKILDSTGSIKPDATENLKIINEDIDNNLSNINTFCSNFIKDNSELLQEKNVCERNNRFVFLFKNSFKNKYDGYDYGTSGSGQASYVEPSSLVNLNNKKNQLEDLKSEEIEKILSDATRFISCLSSIYANNFKIINTISAIYAKAYFGYTNMGVLGKLTDHLYIENVKHPLIDPNKVISNTYSIPNDKKGIIISGSNTGGKTVSLKVIGLSILMTYLGIPVIATNVEVPLYDKIFIDVDSNQSIKDSLSTFSAHLSVLNTIVNESTDKSLVLIDELISGTDPKEAESISLSLIKKLVDIGVTLIATTHYGLIKKYAFDSNKLILSSVEFDKNSLQPTYHYLENTIGESNALDIATRYLKDSSIIEEARKILDLNKSDEDRNFNNYSAKMTEAEQLKNQLELQIKEYTSKEKILEDKIKAFDCSIDERKKDIINKFNNELDNLKNNLEDKVTKVSTAKEINELIEIIDNTDLSGVSNNSYNFKVGDRVRVNDIANPGFIISINGNKVDVDMNGLTIHTNLKSLSILPRIEKKKKYREINMNTAPSGLNLIGQTVEDALRNLDSYLDKVRLANLKKVKIIHGIGTRALQSAVWNRLFSVDFVEKFYSADYYDGGYAVTIVELK